MESMIALAQAFGIAAAATLCIFALLKPAIDLLDQWDALDDEDDFLKENNEDDIDREQ